MKRRLNFAAAIVNDPEVVLLDEPTAGVDPQSRAGILDLVRGLRERGKAVVYTTHYMEEAQRICDRVGIIDQGRLLAMDTVPGLIASHGGSETIVLGRDEGEERIETTDPVADLARLLGTERGRGGADHSAGTGRP
jgi:ABC-2 type transport system ATP-binding protein